MRTCDVVALPLPARLRTSRSDFTSLMPTSRMRVTMGLIRTWRKPPSSRCLNRLSGWSITFSAARINPSDATRLRPRRGTSPALAFSVSRRATVARSLCTSASESVSRTLTMRIARPIPDRRANGFLLLVQWCSCKSSTCIRCYYLPLKLSAFLNAVFGFVPPGTSTRGGTTSGSLVEERRRTKETDRYDTPIFIYSTHQH